ncbi:hypothetical protein EYF80_019824 [Liparis tanakae]|uniref:Uncharacterized protein n=1 Tax=Liparis tanakae TaxID=230148 RepID=A0A4Z2HWJ2_9TELE|nr:hypothetical protein EYF80_019824 [Liparis tanakae]
MCVTAERLRWTSTAFDVLIHSTFDLQTGIHPCRREDPAPLLLASRLETLSPHTAPHTSCALPHPLSKQVPSVSPRHYGTNARAN